MIDLVIPPGEFAAYLFDCDGTLADSMPLHFEAWQKAIQPYGVVFTEERFYAWGGRPGARILEDLAREQGIQVPVHEVDETRERLYLESLSRIQPIDSVIAQVRASRGLRPLAVVSGSPRASVLRTLDTLGIRGEFQALVCSEDVKHPKPAPDCWLRAAELLGVEPARCLVFEDSQLGIEGARTARMKWVHVPNPLERRRK